MLVKMNLTVNLKEASLPLWYEEGEKSVCVCVCVWVCMRERERERKKLYISFKCYIEKNLDLGAWDILGD